MLSPPGALLPDHDTGKFFCGNQSLDDWLRHKALKSEGRTARTYVVCEEPNTIVGYYCISTGAVARVAAPKKISRNAPDPIPVAIVGRLAVTKQCAGSGIGAGMLQDALRRVVQISDVVGCAAAIVHAIDEDARGFYARYGFAEFPGGTRTMFLPVSVIRAAL